MTGARILFFRRLRDLRAALATWPAPGDWQRCVSFYLLFAPCGLALGFTSGLLRFEPIRIGPGALLLLAAVLFFTPALVEEAVFRVLLLPRDLCRLPRGRQLTLCALALCLFVASHVINGLLFHRATAGVFTNPWFLTEAAMLGALCTVVYLTSDSIWPGVMAHWLTVLIWITLLGGQNLISGRTGG